MKIDFSEVNWQEIDQKVEAHNLYYDRKRKLRELIEYYQELRKNKKFYGK